MEKLTLIGVITILLSGQTLQSFTTLADFNVKLVSKAPASIKNDNRKNFMHQTSSPNGKTHILTQYIHSGILDEYSDPVVTPFMYILKTDVAFADEGKEIAETNMKKINLLTDFDYKYVTKVIFQDDTHFFAHIQDSSGNKNLVYFDIDPDTLEITKNEAGFATTGIDSVGYLSVSRNVEGNVMVVSYDETKAYFITKTDNSKKVWETYNQKTFATLFTRLPSSTKGIVISSDYNVMNFDLSLANNNEIVPVQTITVDKGSWIVGGDFNSLEPTQFLAIFETEDTSGDPKGFYMDMAESPPLLKGYFLRTASSDDSKDGVSESTENIVGTNYFIYGLAYDYSYEYKQKFFMVDITTLVSYTSGTLPTDVSSVDINSELLSYVPSEFQNAVLSGIHHIGDNSNLYSFSIVHGDNIDYQSYSVPGKGYSFTLRINTCHQSCDTCEEENNAEKCLTCPGGLVLDAAGKCECHESCKDGTTCTILKDENSCTECPEGYEITEAKEGDGFGKCEEKIEDPGPGSSGSGEISTLADVPTVTCGQSKILGCLKCSEKDSDKCSSCVYGAGLTDYNADFTSGGGCVQCPISGCRVCEMKDGDTTRLCSECSNGMTLKMENGKQVCFQEIMICSLVSFLFFLIFRN